MFPKIPLESMDPESKVESNPIVQTLHTIGRGKEGGKLAAGFMLVRQRIVCQGRRVT